MTEAKVTSTLELSLPSSLLILLLIGFSCPGASEGCDLLYIKAPPSRLFECNPYSQNSQLKLQCQVQAPVSIRYRVEIEWFYNDTSRVTRRIDSTAFPLTVQIDITNEPSMDGDVWQLTSSITISGLSSRTYQGVYFCQVAIDSDIASLSPSNSILLEDEDESGYLNLHPCSDVFSESTMRCAGNIPTITSSSATSVPTTSSPTTVAPLQTTTAVSPSTTNPSRGNPMLNLWVYLLVAVFGMIIVVITILCVGLCLKKNKITASFKHVWNSSTNAQNEIHQLSKENLTEADTTNAAEPENQGTNNAMFRDETYGLFIGNLSDAEVRMATNEAYRAATEPENERIYTTIAQVETHGLSLGNPTEADENIKMNASESEKEVTNITMVKNKTYGLSIKNLSEKVVKMAKMKPMELPKL